MLRVEWEGSGQPAKLMSNEELVRMLEALAEREFADAPSGLLVVEEIGLGSHRRWRGYYTGPTALRSLWVELRAERVMTKGIP